MPSIRLRCVSDLNEKFEVRGAVQGALESIANLVAVVIVEEPLPIEGLPDGPLPTFTATMLGVPSPPEAVQSTVISTLTAEVRDQDGNLVDATYTLANWTWAIVSDSGGGASFTGDDLTVSSAPGTLVISATHNETGAPAMATISVVAAIVLTYVLEGLPAEVVEAQSYPMTARVLNSDGSVNEAYIPANWTFAIVSGPGTITGANSDILTVDAASAPATIVVSATHAGGSDDETVTVIAAPVGDFPEVLTQAGMTEILANQGDTVNFGAGWAPQQDWNDPNKLAVVADVDSKFGNALEKRGFIGDSIWLDAFNLANNVANHRELYIRYVFRLSSNWQRASEEDVFEYGRKVPGTSPTQFELKVTQGSPGLRWVNKLTGADAGDPTRAGLYVANTPSLSVLSKDEYHTLELLHRLNTEGNADGYLRVAVDGIEITSWNILGGDQGVDVRSGVEWASTAGDWTALRLTGLQAFHKWNSGTKSVNDFVRLSELFISGRNT